MTSVIELFSECFGITDINMFYVFISLSVAITLFIIGLILFFLRWKKILWILFK